MSVFVKRTSMLVSAAASRRSLMLFGNTVTALDLVGLYRQSLIVGHPGPELFIDRKATSIRSGVRVFAVVIKPRASHRETKSTCCPL